MKAEMKPSEQFIRSYSSPLGEMILSSDGEALTGLWFKDQKHLPDWLRDVAGLTRHASDRPVPVLDEAVRWLDSYFAGRDPGFTPLLRPCQAGPFRQKVWDALREIPYGETRTYGQIALQVGCPQCAQAVGNAVGHNPVSLIIPCHRVLGRDGQLTGYAAGLERKAWLLRLEKLRLEGASSE